MRQLYQATVIPHYRLRGVGMVRPGKTGSGKTGTAPGESPESGRTGHHRRFSHGSPTSRRGRGMPGAGRPSLRAKVPKHLTRLYTLPSDNPVTDCIKRFPNQGQVYPSPLRKIWDHYGGLIAPEIAAPMETIVPRACPPWEQSIMPEIGVFDRDSVVAQSQTLPSADTVFINGSCRHGLCGAAAVHPTKTRGFKPIRKGQWNGLRVYPH